MYHISGNEFKSLYKDYEYDEGYACMHGFISLLACVLVDSLSPTVPWHPHVPFILRQAPATPHSTRISTPINQMRAAPYLK